MKNASTIQYGYRKCGTHARVLLTTLGTHPFAQNVFGANKCASGLDFIVLCMLK